MGERMMVAAGGQAHGLAVLAEAVRRHNAREIIQKPGKPAAQQDDREQQLQLTGKLLLLEMGVFKPEDPLRPFPQIEKQKPQPVKEQEK